MKAASVLQRPNRPTHDALNQLRVRLSAIGFVPCNKDSLVNLFQLPQAKSEALLRMLGNISPLVPKMTKIQLIIPSPEVLIDTPFEQMPARELYENIKPLKGKLTLDLRDIKEMLSRYLRGIQAADFEKIQRRKEGEIALAGPAVQRISPLLTEELLFKGTNHPTNPSEYHQLIAKVVDEKGRFPNDSEPLSPAGTFSPLVKGSGAEHYKLERKGKIFSGERFTPAVHSQGTRNRLIFDLDLVSRIASRVYRTEDFSYPRELYYDKRLFFSDIVTLLRHDGWPVSFAAISEYKTSLSGDYSPREIFYAFIQFVMTVDAFQEYGLTSHSITEAMSFLYWRNIWSRDNANYFINDKGDLSRKRFTMWAAAHTGRLSAYAGWQRFGLVAEPNYPIAEAIIRDAHRRIGGQQPTLQLKDPYALDQECYPPEAKYRVEKDKIAFSYREEKLPLHLRDEWLGLIGGAEGVSRGNSLFVTGVVDRKTIRASRRREKKRSGGGVLQRWGGKLLGWLTRRGGKKDG